MSRASKYLRVDYLKNRRFTHKTLLVRKIIIIFTKN